MVRFNELQPYFVETRAPSGWIVPSTSISGGIIYFCGPLASITFIFITSLKNALWPSFTGREWPAPRTRRGVVIESTRCLWKMRNERTNGCDDRNGVEHCACEGPLLLQLILTIPVVVFRCRYRLHKTQLQA